VHAAALRVEAGHDVADDAVLAGGVHPLQHDQQRPAPICIEALLQPGETGDVVRERRLGVVLVEIEPAGIGAIERGEAEAAAMVDAGTCLINFESRSCRAPLTPDPTHG
jgi:hypothetical protein